MSETLPVGSSARDRVARAPLRWPILGLVVILHFAIQELTRIRPVLRELTADPELRAYGSWLHYVEHHAIQMVAALVLIALLSRGRMHDWGLSLRNPEASWRLLSRGFFPILLVSLLLGHALVPLLSGVPPERFASDLRALDLVGIFFFSFVLVGLSEEILFRGLFQTLLARWWHGTVRLAGVAVPTAGVWAAIVFTIAHVRFTVAPLGAEADPRQLVLAFVLGIYYAVAYQRTGSLLAPVIAHNAVDGGIVAVELAVAGAMT